MRMVCFFKVVTPAWVTNEVLFLLVIDYIRYSCSFEVLHAKVNSYLSLGPASRVPRALTKHYFAHGGPNNVSSMYIT